MEEYTPLKYDMKTTLNKIKAFNPCTSSWKELLKHLGKKTADDEPLEIKYILDKLSLDDALWALKTVENHGEELVKMAVDFIDGADWADCIRLDHPSTAMQASSWALSFTSGHVERERERERQKKILLSYL